MKLFGLNLNKNEIDKLTEQEIFYFKGYIDSLINNNYSLNDKEAEYKKEFYINFNKKFKDKINDAYEKMFT